MNYLTVENITKYYGEKLLFEDISFFINKGDRIALIAKNGTGKSTLISAIRGVEPTDTGKITLHDGVKIGYLPQEPILDDDSLIIDELFESDNPVVEAIAAYQKAFYTNDVKAIEEASSQMDALDAWSYETRVKQIMSRLSIDKLGATIKHLSGGEKKRVALAKVLIADPDFLILDEPTNHLDVAMIEWLEAFIKKSQLTLFVVTHDRYFLESICDEILELDRGKIYRYKGNYSNFLVKKEERTAIDEKTVISAKSLYKKELDWLRRSPKARTTKSKSRIASAGKIEAVAKSGVIESTVQFHIEPERLGGKIVEMHNVSKSFDERLLFEKFSYKFKKFDKVGIVGKNGAGKSTFLDMMTGVIKPDTGKVVIGETVKFGFYTQEGIQLKADKRVIEVITDIADYIPMKGGKKLRAESLLERFLFGRKQQQVFYSKLSGGEKRRLYLLTVLIQNPNFLILDEPTNDLDILTLNILEEFLQQYAGCLVVVSHDRFFMDKLVDHLFVFEGDGVISDFPGSYSQFRERVKPSKTKVLLVDKKEKAPEKVKEKTKLSYNEQREFEGLEPEMEVLQAKKDELTAQISSGELTTDDLIAKSSELNEVMAELSTKENRWLELAEFVKE